MLEIRCDFPLEYEKGDFVIVQNTSKIEEVKITVHPAYQEIKQTS